MSMFVHKYAKRMVAIAILVPLYFATRQPRLSVTERRELADKFHFTEHGLPELNKNRQRTIRDVHPDVAHLASWISSVGAACSLSDLDGDGLPNDVCYVDTRTDQVVVAPVPGTPARYQPFALNAVPSSHDEKSTAPMGCVPGDLNEDGVLDILVYFWGRTPVAYLGRSLTDTSTPAVLTADQFVPREIVDSNQRWYTNAATRADVDGDGHVDIVIGNYFQDGARILDPEATDTQHMHHAMSRAVNGGRNRLLRWIGGTSGEQPTVHYEVHENVWSDSMARGWTLAIAAGDLDGDLLPELYFANDFGHDRLLHNRSTPGDFRFALLEGRKGSTTPTSKVLGRDSFKGMGAEFADLNNDGHFDIYVSNIAEVFALEESHFLFLSTGRPDLMQQGVAPYADHSERLGLARSGWGWESRLADFNNDGSLEAIQATGFVKGQRNRWPQLHEAAMGNDLLLRYPSMWHRVGPGDDLSGDNPNPFFVRASDGRFHDLGPDLGLNTPQVTRGIATGDVDGDGDLDFVVANQWDSSRFYKNDHSHADSALVLRLLIPIDRDDRDGIRVISGHAPLHQRTRFAIGAMAMVTMPDGTRRIGQIDGGNGHSGTRSPEIHIGLGPTVPDESFSTTLRWRDARGRVSETTIWLTPGWHTIVLGANSQRSLAGRSTAVSQISRIPL